MRRSHRLNKNLEEGVENENVSPNQTPTKPRRIPIPKTPPPSPQETKVIPKDQNIAENFKNAYEDIKNPSSYSADVQAIANGIESYRLEDRLKKLARRLF